MAAPPQNPDQVRGPWSPEEDELLRQVVGEMGDRNWSDIAEKIRGRTGKSCRLRWSNQLTPDVEHRPFTAEEDAAIISAHAQHGNKWAFIASQLYRRTDNAVKNHWNSTLRHRGFTVGCSSDYEVTVVDLNTINPSPSNVSSRNPGLDHAQGYRPDLNMAWNFLPSAAAPPQQSPPQPQFPPSVPAPPQQTPQQPLFLPSFPDPPPQTPLQPQFLTSTTAPPPQTAPQPQFAPPMGTGSVGQSVQELFNMKLTRESAQGLVFSALIEEIKMRMEDEMKQNGIAGINYDQNQIEAMAVDVMSRLGINGVHP